MAKNKKKMKMAVVKVKHGAKVIPLPIYSNVIHIITGNRIATK